MSKVIFKFDREKAIEAILYLSSNISSPELYDICKLLYIVDKESLENYGRFVFGETYYALPEGTTPSHAYNLLKEAREKSINGLRVDNNTIIAEREANLDYLSQSDIECLDRVIEKFGEEPFTVKAEEAHDAAYYKAWGKREGKNSVYIPIEDIAELFANADDLIDYLNNCNAD